MAYLLSVVLLAHWLYASDCCGGHDCKPVNCDEIQYQMGGWKYHGVFFARQSMREAPDGNCHVCIWDDGFPHGQCIYLPPNS